MGRDPFCACYRQEIERKISILKMFVDTELL